MSLQRTPTQLQSIWDKCLIVGWERNWKMLGVGFFFVRKVAPVLGKLSDCGRVCAYITSLGLKRCMEREGGKVMFGGHGFARSFIDDHSRQLTNFLYSKDHSNADILKSIDNFKWKRVNRTKTNSRKIKKNREASPDTVQMRILWREQDKGTDWNTVK